MATLDRELLDDVRSGNAAAFETLMRRYNQRLYRVARAILNSDIDAEDAVQSAYIQAYTHLNQFENKSSLATWLTRITVNEACAIRRHSRAQYTAELNKMTDHTRSGDNPEHQAYRLEMRELIEQAVEKLPTDYRLVFVLREVEELSTEETANCLMITEENVKVRLHRSRKMLRDALHCSIGSAAKAIYAFEGTRCDRIVQKVLSGLRARAVVRSN